MPRTANGKRKKTATRTSRAIRASERTAATTSPMRLAQKNENSEENQHGREPQHRIEFRIDRHGDARRLRHDERDGQRHLSDVRSGDESHGRRTASRSSRHYTGHD